MSLGGPRLSRRAQASIDEVNRPLLPRYRLGLSRREPLPQSENEQPAPYLRSTFARTYMMPSRAISSAVSGSGWGAVTLPSVPATAWRPIAAGLNSAFHPLAGPARTPRSP